MLRGTLLHEQILLRKNLQIRAINDTWAPKFGFFSKSCHYIVFFLVWHKRILTIKIGLLCVIWWTFKVWCRYIIFTSPPPKNEVFFIEIVLSHVNHHSNGTLNMHNLSSEIGIFRSKNDAWGPSSVLVRFIRFGYVHMCKGPFKNWGG